MAALSDSFVSVLDAFSYVDLFIWLEIKPLAKRCFMPTPFFFDFPGLCLRVTDHVFEMSFESGELIKFKECLDGRIAVLRLRIYEVQQCSTSWDKALLLGGRKKRLSMLIERRGVRTKSHIYRLVTVG